jgi:predicted nucleic acid-binding protein
MFYFDSAYVAKCYLNDPDAERVREMVRVPTPLYSSALCIAEVTCAIHRRYRENLLSQKQAEDLAVRFREHVEQGVWTLIPVSQPLLWKMHETARKLPPGVFVRAGDAIHLASARLAGFSEVWTNDRHMLAAASQFGLAGRSI